MRIMGFDISSSTCGWCVLDIDDKDIKYIDSGYFKPSKIGTDLDKLVGVRNTINNLLNKYKPEKIAIEDIIKFMAGKSSANTIVVLAQTNRTVGLVCYDYLKSNPEMYPVLTIRHCLKKDKVLPKKEDMPDLVSHHLGLTFPWEYNRNNKKREENFDRADGIAVALCYAFKLTGKNEKPKKPKKVKPI